MARIIIGDCRETLKQIESGSVQCCVTSPPYYGLRDYGVDGQIGLEQTPDEFVAELVAVFREVRRALRDDGTMWLNIGDSYARSPAKGGSGIGGKNHRYYEDSYLRARGAPIPSGMKPKDLMGIPWMVAFALRADGWYLRQEIIWSKPNAMPEPANDRCVKSHEHLFLLSKSERYYFDAAAIAEVGSSGDLRGRRSVWSIPTKPFRGAHFASFPESLIEPCILAGSRNGDVVLDPFIGAGTTGLVAERFGRRWIGCELNQEYAEIAERRIAGAQYELQT